MSGEESLYVLIVWWIVLRRCGVWGVGCESVACCVVGWGWDIGFLFCYCHCDRKEGIPGLGVYWGFSVRTV